MLLKNQVIPMKEVEILLVEDNKGDVLLTQEALQNWAVKNHIISVCDGEEAINYLKRNNEKFAGYLPDLVILDINLPKVDGKQVLQYIRSEADLLHLPVVIFSSSINDKDVKEASDLKANLYVQKPAELQHFFDAVHTIEQFWTSYEKADLHA